MLFILVQNTLIDPAVNATPDPLINWILGVLGATILTLSGVIVYLYKDKVRQDTQHKEDMKELYDQLNAVIQKAIETMAITNERLK